MEIKRSLERMTKAKGNGSMKRGILTPREILRNKRIWSYTSTRGNDRFSVIKRVFKGDRTQVKTFERVKIKEMFKCFGYNLYQLVTLERKRVSIRLG